jgi:hypothetical protein
MDEILDNVTLPALRRISETTDQTIRPSDAKKPITSRTGDMDFIDAADAMREKLIEHRISRTANLWSTILKQIRKQDSFDGEHVDKILEIIRSFLSQLDDKTAIGLWRTTEAGFADDTDDDYLFPDSIRIDLEMEFLKALTDLAWNEAKHHSA